MWRGTFHDGDIQPSPCLLFRTGCERNRDFTPTANQPLQQAVLRANSDSLAHNVCMSEKRTKADKAQREADLLDKKSSHRPPQNQGKKPREDVNQAAVRIVEEAAEKH